jgi:hypothetical protein
MLHHVYCETGSLADSLANFVHGLVLGTLSSTISPVERII